jgi:hypothetical protein
VEKTGSFFHLLRKPSALDCTSNLWSFTASKQREAQEVLMKLISLISYINSLLKIVTADETACHILIEFLEHELYARVVERKDEAVREHFASYGFTVEKGEFAIARLTGLNRGDRSYDELPEIVSVAVKHCPHDVDAEWLGKAHISLHRTGVGW